MRTQPTDAERVLWQRLRHDITLTGSHFRRQALIGPFIGDFSSRKAKLVGAGCGGRVGVLDEARRCGRRSRVVL